MASFLDTVKSALGKTGDTIKKKTSEVGTAVVNTAVDAKNKVGSAVNTATDFVSFVSDDVGKRAAQTGKEITGTVDDVKNKVSQEWNLFKEASQQSANEAYDAMHQDGGYKDRGIVKNIQGTVLDLAAGGEGVNTMLGEYQNGPKDNKNRALDIVAGLASTPATISSGIKLATDDQKSTAERIEGVTQVGLGGVGLIPGVAAFQTGWNAAMPRDVKEGIQSGVKTINGNISTSLKALGVDKENADPISRILWNAANIAASFFGPKLGNSVSGTVRSAALPTAGAIGRTLGISGRSLATNTGRAIGTITNMAVQASPDLLSLAVDHLENGTDDTVPTKLVSGIEAFLGANMAAVAPLFPGKKALGDNQYSDVYKKPVQIEFTPEGYKKKVTGTAITRGDTTLAIRELPGGSMEIYDPANGKFLNAYSQKGDQWNTRVDDAFAVMEGKIQGDVTYKAEADNSPRDLSVGGMNFKLGKNKDGYTLYTPDGMVLQKSKTRGPLVERLKAMIQNDGVEGVQKRIAQMGVNIEDAVNYWRGLTLEDKQSIAQKAGFRDVDLAVSTIDANPSGYKTTIIDAYLSKQTPEVKPVSDTEIKSLDIPETPISPEIKAIAETPISESIKPKKTKKAKTIKETVQENVGPETIRALTTTEQPAPKTETSVDNIEYTDWEEVPRDDMQSNFGGDGGGNEPPTNGPKDVGFSDNPPDRDIQANEATDIIKGVVANNLPSNRSATLGKGPIASVLRGALGRAYNFFVSARLGGDTLMVEVDNSTPSKVNPETSITLSTKVADGSVPLGLPGSVLPIKATHGKKIKIPFTQFLDITRRGISGGIRNAITRSLKINEQYKPIADNAAELKPEYLIGKSFEDFNGGKVIDADDAAKIIETQKYSDAHTKHSSNAFDENQRKNIYQNSSVYRFVKDDPALASQIFSPEQLTSLKNLSDKNKGNQNAISIGLTLADDSGNNRKYMSKGVMINPDYERISMSYDNYKRFLKDTGLTDADIITAVDTEGRTHTYNSALDFLSAYENKQKGVEFDPDQLASILKERGLDPKLDLYRDQGAAVSMDSFIDNVSRLVSNHETARMIDEAASSKDKTVSGYAKKLRSSSQFMEKALDVIPQRNAVEKGLDWVGKFVTPIRLAFNIKNYLQGTLTSGAQNLIGSTIARNKKGVLAGFSPVHIKEYNDPLVADTLYNNGFTERSSLEWEGIPDTWKGGVTKVSQVSAGAIQEHNGKAAVALREMENFLTENNITTNRSPKDISAKWNEYAEKNGNDPTFLKKKADIKMQTELIGDFGKMSRFTGMGIGRYTKDMKNWTTGQVSSFMRDMGNLGDGQARKRLAIQMTPWVIATATAYAALPESEDRLEKSLRIGSGISFPPFGIYQLVTGTLGSSTVSAIKDIISGGVKLGYISMQDFSGDINDDESNKLYGEQLSRFTDAFGADKGVNAIYSAFNIGKDSFTGENSTPYHEVKATSLGSPVDYKNVTGAGYHKGKDITRATEDLMSAFVDMNYINNQQNFENIDRYKNDPTYTNKEPSLTKGMNIFQKILLGTSTPVNDALYMLKESVLGGLADDNYTMEKFVQQRIDGMHVIDILNSIDKSNTIEDIMVRQDIPQEAKNEMIMAIESITTSMEDTNVDTKNALPKNDTSIYTPKSSLTTNFRGYINELKDNNPYAYNRIIGGIAQLSKSINATNFNGLDAYEKEQKVKELVTSAINPKNTGEQYIDAVIADRNNTKSLTTSFVNKVVDTISDMAWKKDGKVASAEERLDLLNRLAGDIMTLSTNEYLVDSFSEAMTKLFTLENGRVKFLNGFFDKEAMKDKMNNILSFIYTGLGVRGEQKGVGTIESLSETPAQSPQGAAGLPTINPASIPSLLSGAGTGTKIQPLKIIQPKSQGGSGKIPSRGEAKSLAETLGIVKQQKSQPKISQAKLATFSQK